MDLYPLALVLAIVGTLCLACGGWPIGALIAIGCAAGYAALLAIQFGRQFPPRKIIPKIPPAPP